MKVSKGLIKFGPIILFGSGETLPASGKAYEHVARLLGSPLDISILETPAGFQPNTQIVAQKVADFISRRLQNFKPSTKLIPARSKCDEFSTNNPQILAPMLTSNWVFMGPGSPTYAIPQLHDSLTLEYLYALHHMGSALTFSSAGVLAISSLTLPVYEIYKVGEDLHWVKGLNFFSRFGLDTIFIPHWNNNDGGAELDTSRCFMGIDRFQQLKELLPVQLPIIGIDEQTALTISFEEKMNWKITGKGTVTIIQDDKKSVFPKGIYNSSDFGIDLITPMRESDVIENIISKIKAIRNAKADILSDEVRLLAEKRFEARQTKDWEKSDNFRNQINALGWKIFDTTDGFELLPK